MLKFYQNSSQATFIQRFSDPDQHSPNFMLCSAQVPAMTSPNALNRRNYLKTIGAGATIAATGMAGCLGDDEDIVLGIAGGDTGAEAIYGPLIESGADFAIDQINENGGVLDGEELTTEFEDNESEAEATASAVESLADAGAVAITGPVLSDTAVRAREVSEDLEIPHLPTQGASPQLLEQDTRYTFRTGGLPAPYYAGATGQFVEDLGIDTYGAIIADYSYGHSYEAGVEEFIVGREGLDTTVERAPAFDADDYGSQLRAMPEDLEYMDLGGHPVGIFDIIPEMWELGLEPQGISGPGDPYESFWDSLDEDIDRNIIQIHSIDPTSDEYVEVGEEYYEETDGYFDPFAAFGYITANFVAEAIEEAGEAEPETIRDAMSDMSYESMLAYPLEFNEWGELTEGRLVTMEFTRDEPPYYPDGNFHVDVLHESEPFDPIDPTEWE